MWESWPGLCSLLSALSSHKMGNYSSSWSSQQFQDSAGELSDVSLSTEEETMEARKLTVRDLPSEVWACVIAFLPFREKVSSILEIINYYGYDGDLMLNFKIYSR